jgi:uncharacterized membrane protein YtjA (UPF0391 family)
MRRQRRHDGNASANLPRMRPPSGRLPDNGRTLKGNGTRLAIVSNVFFFYKGNPMLQYAVIFFIIAIIAAVFGFTGIAAGAASIAKVLFLVFVVIAVVSLILGLMKR